MKKYIPQIVVLVIAIILSAAFYYYGVSQAETKIKYKEVKASKKQLDSIKATVKPLEKIVTKYKEKKEKAREAEKSIVYDTINCKEIVSNLKEQIALGDTIVEYQDKIIYIDREVIKTQEVLIDKMVLPKPKPFGIGFQVGYGINGKPYIGGGVSINLISF